MILELALGATASRLAFLLPLPLTSGASPLSSASLSEALVDCVLIYLTQNVFDNYHWSCFAAVAFSDIIAMRFYDKYILLPGSLTRFRNYV